MSIVAEAIDAMEGDDQMLEVMSIEERAARLNAFGRVLSESRKEAIDGRLLTGIEDEWREDDDAYDGLDDANRDEYKHSPSKSDPLGTVPIRKDPRDTRSTVLPNITKPYCDAAAARLADMLLPVDEQPFSIDPTPIPQLDSLIEDDDQTPITVPDPATGAPMQTTRAQHAEQVRSIAKDRAKNAQLRIDDQLAECSWPRHMRTVIEDAARLGTGVIKGPEPVKRRMVRWVKDAGGFDQMQIAIETTPGSSVRSIKDCFPDPACGECIQDGNYHWERDSITRKQLAALKGTKGYVDDQIDACLREGPLDTEPYWLLEGGEPKCLPNKQKYQIWYFYGLAKKEDYIAAQPEPEPDEPDPFDDLPDEVCIVATVVNHRVIRLKKNPLNNGEFPYDYYIWSKRPGLPYGKGIARQIRTPQRMLTAGVRNLMDNAALGGGPIIVFDPYVVEPAGDTDDWSLRARKVFLKKQGFSMVDASNAIHVIKVDMVTTELMQIITFALRMAEEVTGLPMILQGQMGEKNATDRVGVAQILNNNGSTVLRRLAKQFDDMLTVPHIRRYYLWNMAHGENPEEKGDFIVIPKGSSTLVERGLQNQELGILMPLSLDIRYGLDPEKIAEEYLRSRHFDPKNLQMDAQKKQQMQSQQDPIALAEAEVKRADAVLKAAQAKKVAAETIKVGVETQYTGIQTGQVAVAVPGVAPVTDVIIQNAVDGLDANDAMPVADGPVPGNVTVEPLMNKRTGIVTEQNTSPAAAPVPPSPDVGAMAGSETQRLDGVRT